VYLETVAVEAEIAQDLRWDPPWLERVDSRCRASGEQNDLVTRERDVACGDELVHSAAQDDDAVRQRCSPSIVNAAFRPEAPMTPPPGWVPEPH
jgi:hypothetical protein